MLSSRTQFPTRTWKATTFHKGLGSRARIKRQTTSGWMMTWLHLDPFCKGDMRSIVPLHLIAIKLAFWWIVANINPLNKSPRTKSQSIILSCWFLRSHKGVMRITAGLMSSLSWAYFTAYHDKVALERWSGGTDTKLDVAVDIAARSRRGVYSGMTRQDLSFTAQLQTLH